MKYDINTARELATMLGYTGCSHTSSACSGKWSGTFDHFLDFGNGRKLFICNGAEHFNRKLTAIKQKLEKLTYSPG